MMKDITITKYVIQHSKGCPVRFGKIKRQTINDYANCYLLGEQQTDCRAVFYWCYYRSIGKVQRICGYFITLAQLRRIFIQKFKRNCGIAYYLFIKRGVSLLKPSLSNGDRCEKMVCSYKENIPAGIPLFRLEKGKAAENKKQ